MLKALAYLNHARWVADCPADGCTDAREVYQQGVRRTEDVCARGHHFQMVMPPPQVEAQIVGVLSRRPVDADRSWYPSGHRRALLQGFPTGQSIADLEAENDEVAAYRATLKAEEQDHLREVLGQLGIEVRPDGTFEGSL